MVTETFSASATFSCLEQLSEATGSMETYGCCSVLVQLIVEVSGMELQVASAGCGASVVNVSDACSRKQNSLFGYSKSVEIIVTSIIWA